MNGRTPATAIAALLCALAMAACQVPEPESPPAVEAGLDLTWVRDGRLSQQGRETLALLRHVEDFGLDPRDFAALLAAIDAQDRDGGDARELDERMSEAARRLVVQLHDGRVDPLAAGYALEHRRAPIDAAAAVRALASAGDVRQVLESFEPRPAQYRALKQALARLRREPDAGPRIRQIELTLERWRWLPDIEAPAVIVNVPQFMLYTLPDPADPAGGAVARIPVIVGQAARQTPVFDSAIESVVFRPYWNVPDSIVREELLPLIAKDVAYLSRHDMEIVLGAGDDAQVLPADAASVAALRAGRARLRQKPGPGNALGLIKFLLPNPYSVYLHSTPETQLFARERRALSHGCIRVSDSAALAAYLLRGTPGDWNAVTIEAATCGPDNRTVRLARPVPVFILYGTAVIDTDGGVLFFDDVYGFDRRLESLLAAR